MRIFTKTFHLQNSNKKGFGLIELLLYIGIFSMLIIILFQMLIAILDIQLESRGHSSVDQDGLYILGRLNYDVQRANTVASPVLGESSPSLTVTVNGNDLTYSLASSNMILTNSSSGSQSQLNSINTEISDLEFSRRSDTQGKNFDTITVSFTLTSKATIRGTRDEKEFRTTIGIRKP
jgi:hypothetical protein